MKSQVVIIGGGLIGCELAMKLADQPGKKITVVEMLDELAGDSEVFSRWTLTGWLAEEGVSLITGFTVRRVTRDKVVGVDKGGNQRELPYDNVILATGLRSKEDISDRLKKSIQTYVVGDNLEAGKIIDAVHDGFNVAMKI